MTGDVYSISIQGRTRAAPHPHVVVLELSGSRECIVVPAFDKAGAGVQEFIAAQQRLGFRPDQVFVEIDNATHVQFCPPYTGKPAYWLVARTYRLSLRGVQKQRRVGTMDGDGLRMIVQGILSLAEARPERFSSSVIKKLRRLAR